MFNYSEAFSRNIGWVTQAEQSTMKQKRVAIAGLGGVGGSHLLTLARLGIGAFHLADFDRFNLVNFNRQAGATLSSLGQPKLEVMARIALDINPELQLKCFPDGLHEHNLDDFLREADVYVDGLDFFAFDMRRKLFAACARLEIPAVTVAPLGMGAALLNFLPGRMSFEQYFGMDGKSELEQGIRFLLGLAPARLHAGSLVDRTRLNLAKQRGPSTGIACQLCAGVAATEVLKILLQRGRVIAAPSGVHFDAYTNALVHTRLPRGNAHPLQRLRIALTTRALAPTWSQATAAQAQAQMNSAMGVVEQILDLARWAPSGDNTQPWRFRITGASSFDIHTCDTRDHVVYDIDGRPTQLAIGALLENLRLAASLQRCGIDARRQALDASGQRQLFSVRLLSSDTVEPDQLAEAILRRSVQRRRLSTRLLQADLKTRLEQAAGEPYEVLWLEGAAARRRMARMLFANAGIRLTMPEAFEVHRNAIEWDSRYSVDRMPDQALGMDPLGLKLMRWAMRSWKRVHFMNRFLAGTWLPRLQLDLVPALCCGAHFLILAARVPQGVDDYIGAGKAMQRLWLSATLAGVQMQPEMTPLIFAAYAGAGRRFSQTPQVWEQALKNTARLQRMVGADILERAVFMGRIGYGPEARARSLRLPLQQLLLP